MSHRSDPVSCEDRGPVGAGRTPGDERERLRERLAAGRDAAPFSRRTGFDTNGSTK